MKITAKKLLIFDLDGTLIDSAPDLALAINHMLQALDKAPFSQQQIDNWVGNGASTLVKRALSGSREIDSSLDERFCQKALEIFLAFYANNLCNETRTYPNVRSTLETLKEKGYILSIVTNKPFAFVAPILESLQMQALFTSILGGDSLEQKKPHPAPLLHTCEKFEIRVEDTLMVGDSKNDIQSANACGMQSIGVTYGYNYGEEIGVHHPSAIINDFGELLAYL